MSVEKVIDLDAIRALEAAATPGPWHTNGDPNCSSVLWDDPDDEYPYPVVDGIPTADAEFIAAARTAVPDLLALLDETLGLLGAFLSEVDAAANYGESPNLKYEMKDTRAFLARFPTPSPTEEEKT